MKLNEFRIDILKQEIEVINQKINHFDILRLRTKQMAIFLWVAVIGFGLKTDSPSDNGLLFFLSIFVPIPFWYLEASFRRYYKGWSERFKAIRLFFIDGEYKIADGTKPTLKDFLDSDKDSNFPLSDYWAEKTVKDEVYQNAKSLRRSFFNHKILWVYFPMVLLSGSYALKKLAGVNWWVVGISAGFLIVLMLLLSLKFNKKKNGIGRFLLSRLM